MSTAQMSPVDARVALAGVEATLRGLALCSELEGNPSRADLLVKDADLLVEARRVWESEAGGFE